MKPIHFICIFFAPFDYEFHRNGNGGDEYVLIYSFTQNGRRGAPVLAKNWSMAGALKRMSLLWPVDPLSRCQVYSSGATLLATMYFMNCTHHVLLGLGPTLSEGPTMGTDLTALSALQRSD